MKYFAYDKDDGMWLCATEREARGAAQSLLNTAVLNGLDPAELEICYGVLLGVPVKREERRDQWQLEGIAEPGRSPRTTN